jgi:hypothetical protein
VDPEGLCAGIRAFAVAPRDEDEDEAEAPVYGTLFCWSVADD